MGYFDSVYQAELSHRAKSVLFYFKDHADGEGKCWPGIRTIANDLGLSRSTVKRALGELVEKGVVGKEKRWRRNGGYTSNMYQITQRG